VNGSNVDERPDGGRPARDLGTCRTELDEALGPTFRARGDPETRSGSEIEHGEPICDNAAP
jgi:hypothetical protein